MKRMKKSTWIAVICVLSSVLLSQIHTAVENEPPETEETLVVSEIVPAKTKDPLPVSTPEVKSKTHEKVKSVSNNVTPSSSPTEPSPSPVKYLLPSSGEVAVPYSDTVLMHFPILGEWRCHLGIDFMPTDNDGVFAVCDGTVEQIFDDHLFGSTVCIDHGNGLKSFYASLSTSCVTEGETITAGKEIGKMGQSPAEEGVHLHFYMQKDGNPIDPFGEK